MPSRNMVPLQYSLTVRYHSLTFPLVMVWLQSLPQINSPVNARTVITQLEKEMFLGDPLDALQYLKGVYKNRE